MKFAPYLRNVAAFHRFAFRMRSFLCIIIAYIFPGSVRASSSLLMNIIIMKSINCNYFPLSAPTGTTTARTWRKLRDPPSAKGGSRDSHWQKRWSYRSRGSNPFAGSDEIGLTAMPMLSAFGALIMGMQTIPLVFVAHSRYRGIIHQPAPAKAELLLAMIDPRKIRTSR